MIDCCLIIVAYRSAADVAALLATVPAAVGDLSWRAIVVNNDPGDDLSEVDAASPETEVIEAGANLGYAGGINRGLAVAPASRWTVFLNPDLRLCPGALKVLVQHSDGRDAAVPTILNARGVRHTSLRREPTVLGALGDAIFGNVWPTRPRVLSETIRASEAYHRPRTVDWATGAAILVPTWAVGQVGAWDAQRFFLYSEETDYCRRLRAAGVSVRFVPDAVVVHEGGGSGTSDALYALLEVNRVRYFRKWHGPVAAALFTLVVILNNLLRAHRSRSRHALRALLLARSLKHLPGGSR